MQPTPAVFGKWNLEMPIYNGAGTVKNTEEVRAMAESPACAVTGGSYTFKKRDGNPGQPLWIWPGGSINSLGIPNGGYEYCGKEMPTMVQICHDNSKAFIASVQGDNAKEFGCMAGVAMESGADFAELNLACPNIWTDGSQKGIFGFYPELIEEILSWVTQYVGSQKRIFLKVPPYSNPRQLSEIGQLILSRYQHMIAAIVGPNTFPNSFVVIRDKGKAPRPAIGFGKGFGGFAGKEYHPEALGQALQWTDVLDGSDVQLIGMGGIHNGETAADFFQFTKAAAVQVVTALFREHKVHPQTFHRIIDELLDVPELPGRT